MTKESILESIDSIDNACLDTEIAVLEAMVSSYEKYAIIVENCNCETDQFDFVVQEGKILDEVKNKGKNDKNKLVTVLMFIPRLIKTLCEIIKKKFENGKLAEKLEEAEKNYDELKTKEEKEAKVEELNNRFEGKAECYYDEKSGKIKFKKDAGDLLTKATSSCIKAVTVSKVYDRLKKEFDYENPSNIRSFIDDIDAASHGDDSVTKTDLFNGGIGAARDMVKHVAGATAAMAIAANEIEQKADKLRFKDMTKDKENAKKQEMLKNVSELSNKMAKVNAEIAAGTGAFSLFVDIIDKTFGLGSFVVDKGKAGYNDALAAYDKGITDELKKKHPRRRNKKTGEVESDKDYIDRLRGIVANDPNFDFKAAYATVKKENKEQIAAEKKRVKEEYIKQKQARRKNDNNTNTTNESKGVEEDNG